MPCLTANSWFRVLNHYQKPQANNKSGVASCHCPVYDADHVLRDWWCGQRTVHGAVKVFYGEYPCLKVDEEVWVPNSLVDVKVVNLITPQKIQNEPSCAIYECENH